MTTKHFSLWEWLLSLFDPPPLNTMTRRQKIGRIVLFVATLVVISILSSMVAAAGIFAFQQLYQWSTGFTALAGDLAIIFVSMIINTFCVIALIEIKKADHKLILRPPPSAPPRKEEDGK